MLPPEMQEEKPMESNAPAQPRSPGGRRRGRRGGRGRGRGPRRTASGAPAGESDATAPGELEIQATPSGEIPAPVPDAPASEQPAPSESPPKQIEPEPPIRLREEMPVRPAPSKHKSPPHVSAVASPVRADKPHGSAIGRTVEEVRQIVESLEQALEQMEEVLRLVELAEQQKSADDRELESLRRALHRLQPPRREPREPGG